MSFFNYTFSTALAAAIISAPGFAGDANIAVLRDEYQEKVFSAAGEREARKRDSSNCAQWRWSQDRAFARQLSS
ncbi:MAG: hypothetical protein AAF585_14480 [Verrucomicrobiota bacterium]